MKRKIFIYLLFSVFVQKQVKIIRNLVLRIQYRVGFHLMQFFIFVQKQREIVRNAVGEVVGVAVENVIKRYKMLQNTKKLQKILHQFS